MTLRLDIEAVDGAARAATVTTARGSFSTPCFMPVGTRAAVRTLSSLDLAAVGAEVALANTYHLMLRPGTDIVAGAGGLHSFWGWGGHLLTDSGGYQVFTLSPAVDEDGVTFKSVYDGSQHRLTPEGAVAAQEAIGADIQMVLDVCPPLPSPPEVVRSAVERTLAWAQRARAVHRHEGQSLFGIVQGGIDETLRAESARRTVELDFHGYGIGGLSVGEARPDMLAALAAVTPELPAERPRYLMGVGDPVGLLEAISLGVDMFDSVLPTRLARHGTILTSTGRLNIGNAEHARSGLPLDPECRCVVCATWSRAYLRHLHSVGEPGVARLFTLHNLSWVLGLVAKARDAIREGRLPRLRAELVDVWGA